MLITYDNLEDGTPVTAGIFNERFAQIIAQLNGNINDENLLDDGISKEKLKAEVYESLYPVGSMYVNFTDNTNPGTLLGFGTWTAVTGRFVAGYDGTQTEFNAAEKTGGHKLLQAHTHSTAPSTSDGNVVAGGSGGSAASLAQAGSAFRVYSNVQGGSTGGGDGENLPPYIVGYVWKRVS